MVTTTTQRGALPAATNLSDQLINRGRNNAGFRANANGALAGSPQRDQDGYNGNEPLVADAGGERQWSASAAFFTITAIFLLSLVALIGIYTNFPEMDPSDKKHLKMPRSIKEASAVAQVLEHYTDQHFYSVALGITILYIFLQTFAIPGSIFLSVMCGCLFNWMVALLIICFCSATGATLCYLISLLIGRTFVRRMFPERIEEWARGVQRHRDNIFHYMVFLRITPFLPNWFINITSPVLDVPIIPFYMGTFFGVIIPSLVAIHSGTMLHEYAASGGEPISFWKVIALGVFGFLALLPVLIKNWLREKAE